MSRGVTMYRQGHLHTGPHVCQALGRAPGKDSPGLCCLEGQPVGNESISKCKKVKLWKERKRGTVLKMCQYSSTHYGGYTSNQRRTDSFQKERAVLPFTEQKERILTTVLPVVVVQVFQTACDAGSSREEPPNEDHLLRE